MSKRKGRRDYWEDDVDRIAGGLAVAIVLVVAGLIAKYGQQIITYGIITIIVLAGVLGVWLWKRKQKAAALNLDDEKILYMLRGMSPTRFEQEMANMFIALGFSAEQVGGTNDGGVDVTAHKDGKKYYIQCKKFMTREVTPRDVRDFLGAITNINSPAEKGYFVTTNKFTLAAEKAAEANPRIELIDATRLVEYYKMAFGKNVPVPELKPELPAVPAPAEPNSRTCPRCGDSLVLRTAHKGEHAGHHFWGCANFPKCKYLENIAQETFAH